MKKFVKKLEGRRTEIIKTARNLFQSKEYAKTTMQDIMAALGIAKGTIYHYFTSKEALLEAVIEDIVDEKIKQMQTIIKKSRGSVLETIKLLVQAGNMALENRDILEHLHSSNSNTMHNRLLAATLLKQAPLYANLIQKGCKTGIFKTETPLECAEFILSAIQFLTDVGIYPWTQVDIKRRIEAFPRLIEQLLQAPQGSFQFLIDHMRIAKF